MAIILDYIRRAVRHHRIQKKFGGCARRIDTDKVSLNAVLGIEYI